MTVSSSKQEQVIASPRHGNFAVATYEESYEEGTVQSTPPTSSKDEKMNPSVLRAMGGAAVVGGVAGLALVGPVIGLVAAGGAAALASTKGKAGDATRATGTAVADVGKSLQKFDKKHQLSKKTAESITKGAKWVSEKVSTK